MRATPAPVALDVLAGHLGTVHLPARTTALLDRVRTGTPPRRVWSDPDALDGKAASGSHASERRDAREPGAGEFSVASRPRDFKRQDAREPKAVDSSVAREPVPLEALVVDLLAERLTRLLEGLFDVTEQPNITPLIRSLSGLGPGLTPTGDDLVVGIAAACQRLVAGGSWPATRGGVLSAALAEMGDTGTTSVAREMVGRAAVGQFPEVLTDFVELLGDPDTGTDQVQAAAERLAAIGAHSGADMLAGVVAVAVRACREGEAG